MEIGLETVGSDISGLSRYLVAGTTGFTYMNVPRLMRLRVYISEMKYILVNIRELPQELDIIEYDHRLSRWYIVRNLEYLTGFDWNYMFPCPIAEHLPMRERSEHISNCYMCRYMSLLLTLYPGGESCQLE